MTRPPNQTIRSPDQTTSSDHPTRPQDSILAYSVSNQHSIPSLLKWYRSGAFFVGLGRGGYIELWMNLAKQTFHTRSAWSFRTLFRLRLIVVRLASGFPGLVRASPSLFHKMGSFAGVRSAIRIRLLRIGSAFFDRFGILDSVRLLGKGSAAYFSAFFRWTSPPPSLSSSSSSSLPAPA